MAKQIENFADLLATTLNQYGEPKYTDLTTDTQDFVAAKELVKRNQMMVKAGAQLQWKLKVATANSARNIAITDHDQVNIVDGFITGTINWRKSETKYAFYEEEQDINMPPKQLVNLIEAREDDAQRDWITLLEQNFWNFPATSDTRTPYGLPYWLVKNASTGFNGGVASGYSDTGGVSPTTYPRWANYTAQYVAVTPDDLIRKARTMQDLTQFKPRVPGPLHNSNYGRRAYFTNQVVKQRFEDIADSKNDNHGSDVAKFDNSATFRGAPVRYVPYLDADTTDPFYQLDFDVFKLAVKSGWWMKRKKLDPYPGQRNVIAVFIDTLYNFICLDRRPLGVIATGTTYSY